MGWFDWLFGSGSDDQEVCYEGVCPSCDEEVSLPLDDLFCPSCGHLCLLTIWTL